MNIVGTCKECGADVPLKECEIADCVYECPKCYHPHTLGEFCGLIDILQTKVTSRQTESKI